MAEAKRIFLVSCVGLKKTEPAPAAELYISPWFSMARHLVERAGVPWFILSAEHGLVAPDAVIAPYDRTLNTMGVADRRAWADRVRRQLEVLSLDADEVVILAGERYREYLMPWLRERFLRVTVPMERLPIGRQLSWMKHATTL
jgi:hypothetical protein